MKENIIMAMLGSGIGMGLGVYLGLINSDEWLMGFIAYNAGWIHALVKIKSGNLSKNDLIDTTPVI